MKQEVLLEQEQDSKDVVLSSDVGASEAALGALLEEGEGEGEAGGGDAEGRVRRLAERVARLDALNVGGMLAAATGGAGAALGDRLEAGLAAGGALAARLRRLEAAARGAPDAGQARSGAARADASARALLHELAAIAAWLDVPEVPPDMQLGTAEGRARALAVAEALRTALRAERSQPAARLRLAAVRDKLRRIARARDQMSAALARHLNNALIHLGNEAGAGGGRCAEHRAQLRPYAPFLRWLRELDARAYLALRRLYVGTWARHYERELRAACDAARHALHAAPAAHADAPLDQVLTLVEETCNAEQEFCAAFFCLDVDLKGEGSDGSSAEGAASGGVEGANGVTGAGGADGAEGGERRVGPETRALMSELFPRLEAELGALVAHVERADAYGAMRALACVGRRALRADERGDARWVRGALGALAVAAKRAADRAVAERIAAMPEHVRAAARRPKCGVLGFIREFEELSAECERIFAGGRRADLDRWYAQLAEGMARCVAAADHPRTPRAVLLLENYHGLHAALAARRVPALDAPRRDARARYADALRQYVTQYFGRPLEKITLFFEGVAEAVAGGAREDEVCYRAAFSKHELRRLLAMYPEQEVRKSLHRLYRTVEKHLSEESGLLQVVWRAMQEEFLAQHLALQARIAACYPGAGLSLPLSTQDILDAFSDIAREH